MYLGYLFNIRPGAKVRGEIALNYGGITRKSRAFSRVITPVNTHNYYGKKISEVKQNLYSDVFTRT